MDRESVVYLMTTSGWNFSVRTVQILLPDKPYRSGQPLLPSMRDKTRKINVVLHSEKVGNQ